MANCRLHHFSILSSNHIFSDSRYLFPLFLFNKITDNVDNDLDAVYGRMMSLCARRRMARSNRGIENLVSKLCSTLKF
jgi:hypothetical protein